MRKFLLLAGVAVLGLPGAGEAALISNLGINPTSAQGDFSNSPGGGVFSDQYTFQLVGGPQFITITSATNVFPTVTDFITGWTAAVWSVGLDGIVNNGDDVVVIGPNGAQACPLIPSCQFVAGSGLLAPGGYYLELNGTGGGTSGYGGNLATFAVPGPIVGAGLPSLAALGLLWLARWRRRSG